MTLQGPVWLELAGPEATGDLAPTGPGCRGRVRPQRQPAGCHLDALVSKRTANKMLVHALRATTAIELLACAALFFSMGCAAVCAAV